MTMKFALGEPLRIYQGPIEWVDDGVVTDGDGEVEFVWHPSPRFRCHYRLAGNAAHRLLVTDPESFNFRFPGWSGVNDQTARLSVSPVAESTPVATGTETLSSIELGDGSALLQVRVHLVNFVSWDLRRGRSGPMLDFGAHGWRVQIQEAAEDRRDSGDAIEKAGGYAVTHVLLLERVDGQPFSIEEARPALNVLFLWCTFVRGSHVGQLMPEGLDANGRVVYVAWSSTVVDPWTTGYNWCDTTITESATALFREWLGLSRDPFWSEVLKRATRMYASANRPRPLELAIPAAMSALEMLGWAVLVITEDWVRPEERQLTAAGMLRLLLRWAGIPSEVDSNLAELVAFAQRDGGGDVATALTKIRNRLVHPPKRAADWPSADVLIDAWRGSMELLELVMLRILRYEGDSAIDTTWAIGARARPWRCPGRRGPPICKRSNRRPLSPSGNRLQGVTKRNHFKPSMCGAPAALEPGHG